MTAARLGMSDHSVHIRIVLNIALRRLRLGDRLALEPISGERCTSA